MCEIAGYLGPRWTQVVVLAGLRRVGYAGYDPVGIALLDAPGKGDDDQIGHDVDQPRHRAQFLFQSLVQSLVQSLKVG